MTSTSTRPKNGCTLRQQPNEDEQNPDTEENYWFPTPKNPGNTQEHTPIQSRILRELQELQAIEKLNPQDNPESREIFLSNFD